MIVLDTNVLSEPLRPSPDRSVVQWLDRQPIATLFLTTVTLAEIRYGIAALPHSHRKTVLHQRFEDETVPLFDGRILSFDEGAATAYALLQAAGRAAGRPLPVMDGLIAAICSDRGLTLATRNIDDFRSTGIDLLDPWTTAP